MASVENTVDVKRELFIWKPGHEEHLLREVLVVEPYQFKPSSKERGTAWKAVAENLQKAGMKVTNRSVRERFDKLVKDFKRKEAMENRASGVDVEFSERDKAMTDILERMSEYEMAMETQKQKGNSYRATAEEMRRRATERLGETRRRHSEENESDNDDVVTPERKRRRSSDVLEVLKGSLEVKKKEQEKSQNLREREMEILERHLNTQQDFQKSIIEQQQHFQLQQQAVTMSIVNTLAELVKNIKK